MSFVYKADPVRGEVWKRIFAERAPELDFRMWPDIGEPAQVRFLAAWTPPPDLATALPNLEVLFCTGAGIDRLDLAQIPGPVKVVRMIEPGLTAGMVEYVTLAVLSLHRDWPAYAAFQRERRWQVLPVLPAGARRVGIMGLGVLGTAVAAKLGDLGFGCLGWNRTPRDIAGVECHHGAAGLDAFLPRCDYVVCLLPLTAQTQGILDRRLFAKLPEGAAVINVGRGGHLVQDDLLEALDAGKLSAAILDVCDPEPLPPDHRLWTHPRVVLTPHIASETQPATAVPVVLENVRRYLRGEAMAGLVDRGRGY